MLSLERIPEVPKSTPLSTDSYIEFAVAEESEHGYVSHKESRSGLLKRDLLESSIRKINIPPCKPDFNKYEELLALAD